MEPTLPRNPYKLPIIQGNHPLFHVYANFSRRRGTRRFFLLSIIAEIGLRLRPPTPANLPRVTPPEGMMIAGQFIPGGVTFLTFH